MGTPLIFLTSCSDFDSINHVPKKYVNDYNSKYDEDCDEYSTSYTKCVSFIMVLYITNQFKIVIT